MDDINGPTNLAEIPFPALLHLYQAICAEINRGDLSAQEMVYWYQEYFAHPEATRSRLGDAIKKKYRIDINVQAPVDGVTAVEHVHIPVARYTVGGVPTCALDFRSGAVCPFLTMLTLSTTWPPYTKKKAICGPDDRELWRTNGDSEMCGFLIPHDTCRIWHRNMVTLVTPQE